MAKREKMTSVDSAWLHMEDPTNLMMITGVLLFDAPLRLEDLKMVVEDRLLAHFPRFKQRVVEEGLLLKTPYWEDDPHFNLDAHIHHIALPTPGDDLALQELVSDFMSTPLDFSKPLWQFHLVDGYGAGCAIMARLHHAIADGIALVRVLLSLTDEAPEVTLAEPAPADSERWNPLENMARTARSALRFTQKATERLRHEWLEVWQRPGETLADLAQLGAGSALALSKSLLLPPDNMTVFRGPLGISKKAVWSRPMPLEQVKAVGRVTGGTVNDVLMAALTGALRRYLLERDSLVETIRAFVPVNIRPPDEPIELGNKFSLIFLTLPVGKDDLVERLLTIKAEMDRIKQSPEAVVNYGILNALGVSPKQVQEMAVEMFAAKATAVVTNVPGPRQAIYLAGQPLKGIMFWVPQSGRVGLGVSILSYNQQVMLGVASDVGLAPDPEQIVAYFHQEFEEMLSLVAQAEENAPAESAPAEVETVAAAYSAGVSASPVEPLASTAVEVETVAAVCQARTKAGQPCRNHPLPDSLYCRVHQGWDDSVGS